MHLTLIRVSLSNQDYRYRVKQFDSSLLIIKLSAAEFWALLSPIGKCWNVSVISKFNSGPDSAHDTFAIDQQRDHHTTDKEAEHQT